MFLAAVTLATQISGSWSMSPAQSPADVRVELHYALPGQDHNEEDEAISLAALGLRRTDVDGTTHATQFALNRDAGSIAFTGGIGDGVGAGHFLFSPSASYSAAIEHLGISQPSPEAQLGAVLLDVSLSYVTAMVGAGVHSDFSNFLACRALRIEPAYARALLAQFPTMTTHELIAYGALHVTPDYVASLREAGVSDLTPGALISLRALHIDAAFIRDAEHRGYAHPSVDELSRLKVLNE